MKAEVIQKAFDSYADLVYPFASTEKMDRILETLRADQTSGRLVFPQGLAAFKAFQATPLNKVRIVLIGMDPYPRPEFATGLAFSCPPETKTLPPSLEVIFKKIESGSYNGLNLNTGSSVSNPNPDLTRWADQGILLLNSALTVGTDPSDNLVKSGVHVELWKPFTTYFIKALNEVKRNLIFIAWGEHAKEVVREVDIFTNSHFVITSEHPVNAKRHNREWETDTFDRVNAIIKASNLGEPIVW